jgi:preprotein translocase SecE subunit
MASKASDMKEISKVGGFFGLVPFLKDSWLELKKVHHPSRPETIQATIVVLAMVVTVALFLGTVDMILGWLMRMAMGS